jgi:hypothetical protein
MALPMVGIHTGSELSRTSFFAAYSIGGFDALIDVDSSGNQYICYLNGTLVKINSKNVVVWQKTFSGISLQSFSMDTSGNLYVCGTAGSYPTPNGIVVKLDSSGNITWQRAYQLTEWVSSGGAVYADPSGNVYCGFWYGPSNNDYADLAKYNSSGTLQWRIQMTTTAGTNCRPGDISTDSSGNVYMGAHTYNPSFGWESYAIKVNSSGSVQWQRKIYDSTYSFYISGGTFTDSSANVYFYGFRTGAFGSRTIYLTKLDTNGNMLWQKEIAGTSSDYIYNGHLDFDGTYLYVQTWGSRSGVDSYNKSSFLLIDTSGNLVLQRSLDMDGVAVYSYGIAATDTHVYMAGYGPYKWNIKVSKNGKKTGVYSGIGHTMTYYTSNFTWQNSNASITNGGLSISSVSSTTTTPSVSLANANGTYAVRTF